MPVLVGLLLPLKLRIHTRYEVFFFSSRMGGGEEEEEEMS